MCTSSAPAVVVLILLFLGTTIAIALGENNRELTTEQCFYLPVDASITSVSARLLLGGQPMIFTEIPHFTVGIADYAQANDGTEGMICLDIGRTRNMDAVHSSEDTLDTSMPSLQPPATKTMEFLRERALAAVDSVSVQVDYLTDSPPEASACVGSTGLCNFRSAISYCMSALTSPDSTCEINFPIAQTMHIDPNIGEIEIIDVNGTLVVNGNDCVVSPLPNVEATTQLLVVDTTASFETFGFALNSLTVLSFGDDGMFGGAISLTGVSFVFISNAHFEGQSAELGGSIFMQSCRNIAIIDCSFFKTVASNMGGAIYVDDVKGMKVTNCFFNNTLSIGGGGAILAMADNTGLAISNCTFYETFVENYGGAIGVRINNSHTSITNCFFYHTYAGGSGGAINAEWDNDGLVVENCLFVGTYSGKTGGAVVLYTNNDDVVFSNCTFTSTAAVMGGAIGMFTTNHRAVIIDCVFESTLDIEQGGGAMFLATDNVNVSISRCSFSNTRSVSYGGVLYADTYNTGLTIRNSTFANCSAAASGGAIALNSLNNRAVIADSVFTDMRANFNGGVFYISTKNDYLLISNCVFNRSHALDGGAIFLLSLNQFVVVSDSGFIDNTAIDEGGAVNIWYANTAVKVLRCEFLRSDGDNGGAMYIGTANNYVEIENCTFKEGFGSQGAGIVIDIDNIYVIVRRCVFNDTYSIWYGGAVYLGSNNRYATIASCDFTSTYATYGGAIYMGTDNTNGAISDSSAKNTCAVSDGGFVALNSGNSMLAINRCNVIGARAGSYGGALSAGTENERVSIKGCNFQDCSSGNRGGAVYLKSDNNGAVIEATMFLHSFSTYGGAVYLGSDNGVPAFFKVTFNNSYAKLDGGAIYFGSNNIASFILSCEFTGSLADDYGGAIYMKAGNDDTSIGASIFDSNFGARGGAVYVGSNHHSIEFVKNSFQSNTAIADGGAIVVQDSNFAILFLNCTFEGNLARSYGGGIAIISYNELVSIDDCVFIDNEAVFGGGAIQSSLANVDFSVNGCLLDSNSASFGGGLYFGDYHVGIEVLDTTITSNRGDYGAGLYATQFNAGLTLVSVVMQLNVATEQGGAMFILLADVLIFGGRVVNNFASSIGAVYARVNSIEMTSCVVNGNVATSGVFGGVLIESSSLVSINSTEFRYNEATSGGGLGIINSLFVSIWNSTFAHNEGLLGTGGAMLLHSTVASITGSVFKSNFAYNGGGGMHGTQTDNLVVSSSVFQDNEVVEGSGSAIYLAESAHVNVSGIYFDGNSALQGGGTVFWEASSGMPEPSNLINANTFTGTNIAFYGTNVATDAHRLQLSDSNNYEVTDYSTAIPPVVAYVVDFYDQTVRTESKALVVASLLLTTLCYKSTGYVTGGFVQQLSVGASNFTSLYAYCDPGYYMPVNLTSAIGNSFLTSYFTLHFRECVRGEYFSDSICTPCEEGTYSLTEPSTVSLGELTQQKVCKKCPDGASRCYGDTIELEDGYWRISDLSHSTLSCPYPHSCGGGSGAGDELCLDGYEGPVCGICSDGYAYRTSTRKCEPCSDSSSLDAVVILLVCVVSVVGLVAAYVYFFTEFRTKVKTVDDAYVLLFSKLGLLPRLSPSYVTDDPDTVAVTEARAVARRFQARLKIYITLWQIVSLLPFALDLNFPNVYSAISSALNVFNLGISTSSLVTCSADNGYDAIDALVVDTVYPLVVVGLLWTFYQVHLRITSTGDVAASSHLSARYFNVFLVFTYLILPFTSVQIFQVFSCQDVDPDNVDSGDDRYMTVDYSVSCSSSKYRFGFVWAIVSIVIYPVGIPLYYFFVLFSARHDIINRKDNTAPVALRVARKTRLHPLRLLFEYYEPHLWYWEVIETINRLFLTGVLVVVAQGSAVQIVVGIVVSLVFLKVCDIYRPFVDDKVQTLKEISQWQIFSVFFLALLLKADFGSIETVVLDVFFVLAVTANVAIDGTVTLWSYCVSDLVYNSSKEPGVSDVELAPCSMAYGDNTMVKDISTQPSPLHEIVDQKRKGDA